MEVGMRDDALGQLTNFPRDGLNDGAHLGEGRPGDDRRLALPAAGLDVVADEARDV
jgi:hypothetical protein